MDSLLAIAIISVLILLNGLFVAAEFAIVAAPRMALERRARTCHRVAAAVIAIVSEPRRQDQFIATAQVGITFASLGLGMYGEHVVAAWFATAFENLGAHRYIAAHAVASVLSVVVLTYFHIVVGEMVPKSLALQQAERTVLWVAPLMQIVRPFFHPPRGGTQHRRQRHPGAPGHESTDSVTRALLLAGRAPTRRPGKR